MKFGQIIECNMRKCFLEKPYTKCGGEAIPRIFYKKSKLNISLDQYPEVYRVGLYYIPNCGLSKYVETKLQTTCFYLILSIFVKIKRGLELVSLSHFLHNY